MHFIPQSFAGDLDIFPLDPLNAGRLPIELSSDSIISNVHNFLNTLYSRLGQPEAHQRRLKNKIRREIAPTVLIGICLLNILASNINESDYQDANEEIDIFQVGCGLRHDKWMMHSSVRMLFDEFERDVHGNENDLGAEELSLQRLRLRVFLGKCTIKMDWTFSIEPKDEARIRMARGEWEIAKRYVLAMMEHMPDILEDVKLEDIYNHIESLDRAISCFDEMKATRQA